MRCNFLPTIFRTSFFFIWFWCSAVWNCQAALQEPANNDQAEQQKPKAIYDSQEVTQPLLSHEQSVAAFKLPEGFSVDLFAGEPDVQQPIGMAWDAKSRLWVAENFTYAESKLKFDTELSDKIVIFEDTDGDGKHDQRKVFWDQAKKLTSIEIGYGGVWAMCSPQLLFIPDADGDDVPDGEPIVVLDGFDEFTIHHNLANGLKWGPDGWLYGRHGIQATSLIGPPGSADHERKVTSCSIWRYHPTRKVFDIVCNGTTNSWGMDWDQHGNLFFINTVIGHLWHALPNAHVERMYGVDPNPSVYKLMPQIADHVHWDSSKENWNNVSKEITQGTDQAGGGHAHCGMMIYRGTNWPEEFRNELYTINYHGRRMNREHLERSGAGFVGQHREDCFFTDDVWFRGIEMSIAPDSTVYVLDWSDIGECHENDGVHRHSGRIFRIRYGTPEKQEITDLNSLKDNELIDLMSSDSVWHVRQARRVLVDRHFEKGLPEQATKKLINSIFSGQSVVERLECLWTLASCEDQRINTSLLIRLLSDREEAVRIWAWQLLTDLPTHTQVMQRDMVQAARKESSDLVNLYMAGCLSRIQTEAFTPIALHLIAQGHLKEDRDFPLMLWYSLCDRVAGKPNLAVELISNSEIPVVNEFIARRLAETEESRTTNLEKLFVLGLESQDQMKRIARGVNKALKGVSKVVPPKNWSEVAEYLQEIGDDEAQAIMGELSVVFGDGRGVQTLIDLALDNSADFPSRHSALLALANAKDHSAMSVVWSLAGERDLGPAAIGIAQSLGSIEDAQRLVELFPSLRANGKDKVVTVLTSRTDFIPTFLQAVDEGDIARADVSASTLRQLQYIADDSLAKTLKDLFPNMNWSTGDKIAQVKDMETELSAIDSVDANLENGKLLFAKACGTCHKLFGEGKAVGPELTGAQRRNVRYFVENVIDPSAAVADNYRIELFAMDGGIVVTGVPIKTTSETIEVQTATEVVTLSVEEIVERKPTGKSLMPDGLLDNLSESERRDLYFYFKSENGSL